MKNPSMAGAAALFLLPLTTAFAAGPPVAPAMEAGPMPAAAVPLYADTAALRAAVQAHLDSLRAAGRFAGVSAGIVLADGSRIAVTSGLADREAGTPLTPETRFLAGSVGKTYFAALALQLVQDGRLELDAPIARHLGTEPWFDRLPNARTATVRMLMNHTSGLVRYEFDERVMDLFTAEPDKVWSPEERLSYLFDTEPPFAAGEGWNYSDTNYIVLAMILERITGTDAYAEIERRFIAPLALRGTVPSDRRTIPRMAQGYAGPDNPFGRRDRMLEDGRFIVNPQMEWAGGGYASTPLDLAVWAKALYEGRFHDDTTLRAMLDATPASGLGPNTGYGLGVIIRQTDLGTSHGHSGFFPGYLSEMRYYPQHGMAVAVQFNTSVGPDIGRGVGAVVHDIARLAAGR